jgi:hypothetical protein
MACAVAWPSAARADANLDYEAPPGCPSATDLADKARLRLPDDRHDLPDLSVAIAKRQNLYVATVTVGDDETRTLSAPTCEEIVDAIAVIVAVRASQEREAALHPATVAESEEIAPAVEPPPSPPENARSRSPDADPPARRETPREPAEATPRRQSKTTIDLHLGTGAVLLLGVAPGPAWGPAIVGGVGSSRGIEWNVRLGLERASAGTTDLPPGAVWARWTMARATGCVFAAHSGRISAQPCFQLVGGLLEAEGGRETPLAPERIDRPWVGVGPALRVGLVALPILDIVLDAAMPVPLVRERMIFRMPTADQEAHETRPVTLALSLSLELRTDGTNRAMAGIAE